MVTVMAIPPTLIEETAIAEIAKAHTAALVLYARQFFQGGNLHAAEDVVQEVLHRLSRQPNLPENLAGWLYTAVRNGAISAAKSDKRRTKREHLAGTPVHPLFQPEADNPFDVEKIAISLEKLDRETREIVTLHIWSDLPFSEIATLLGKPKTTVHRRYQEALEMLREMLEDQ